MPKQSDPRKYETTKKAKKQVDDMTTSIASKLGFNAPKAKVSPTPKATIKPKTPSPSSKTNYGPLPKNPTLNDYLARGIRPPVKGKTPPPDYDVIIKGFNDKKTTDKYKKK